MRLLEGPQNEPTATAGAKGSSGGICITIGESRSTSGPGLLREALRKLTMETRAGQGRAGMKCVALPPTNGL